MSYSNVTFSNFSGNGGQYTAPVSSSDSITQNSCTNYDRITDNSNNSFTQEEGLGTPVDSTPPSVPSGLTSPSHTASSVTLNWAPSTDNVGVAGYKVYRYGTQVGTTSTTSFTDTGLCGGCTYSYTVSAYDAAGNTSAQSAAAIVTTALDTSPPTVPNGLTMTSNTLNTITFSWTPSTDNIGVTGYRVYRNGVLQITQSFTSFTDFSLAAGTTYSYTVAAYDAAGNTSAQSIATSFATPAKAGDINSDGSVDIFDLSILGSNFGQCGKIRSQGDLSGDGCVNVFDLSILASNWGN